MLKSKKHLALKQLAWLTGLSLGATVAAYAQTIQSSGTASLKEVVISGSRSEQYIDDLPVSMDVIGTKEIEANQIRDIRDVAKYLPNVSVTRAPSLFRVTGSPNSTGRDGNAGFNIRGLGGNRVLMLVDDLRLPRSYVNGNNAFGRDSLSIDLIKRIEVVRGPASVLYGSDGLAGLVNFITHEPLDFLIQEDGSSKPYGGKVIAAYSGDDQGMTLGGTIAARASDTLEWLFTATANQANGLSNMGTNDSANVERTTPNPQSDRGNAVLGKVVIRPNSGQKHVVTAEHVTKSSYVDLLSSRAKVASSPSSVVGETSSATMDRDRISWDARYQMPTAMTDTVRSILSYQSASSREVGLTDLKSLGDRLRDTVYDEQTWQAHLQADKLVRMSPKWSQKITYGFDYSSSTVTSFFDGSDPVGLPPGTPVFIARKYFPDTRESARGIYGQTELIGDDWSITPGVRFDRFSLDVLSQSGYSPPSTTLGRSLSGSAVSPKLGVLFRATENWSVFGNYASGFRAPNAQQINFSYENTTARLLPNPDLKPEESQNLEFGLRGQLDQLVLNFAIFKGQFSNLIYDKKPMGIINGVAQFQTVNIDSATISGFEIEGNVNWGQGIGGQLSTPFAYGVARGTDGTTGLPLNSIDPAKLVIGLKYETPVADLRLDVIYYAEKNAGDLDSPFIPKSTILRQFTIPAATTLDLNTQWRIRKDRRLNFAIVNLTDRKYWKWSDVQGLASNASPVVVDAYTQPGRHLNVSFVADF